MIICNGYLPHPKQLPFHQSKAKFRAMITGVACGKCIIKDSLITLSDGTQKPIQNIDIGDRIITFDDSTSLIQKVSKTFYIGFKEGIKVKLQGGFNVTGSADHKYLVADRLKRVYNSQSPKKDKREYTVQSVKWIKAKNLKKGDKVAIPHKYKREIYNIYDSKLYELFGYLLGDGCLRNRVSLSIENDQVYNRVKSLLPNYINLHFKGGVDYNFSSYLRDSGGHNFNPFFCIIKDLGLWNTKSNNKFIPDSLLCADKYNLFQLLSGLLTTDGWVDKIGLGYGTVSDALKDGIMLLLKNLGITYVVAKRNVKYNGEIRYCWQFSITRRHDLQYIYENTTLLHKGVKLKRLIDSKPEHPTHKGRNKKFYLDDLEFCYVRSVENVGQVEMYDLEISGTHNYVANNVIVHNTAAGANEMLKVALQYPKSLHLVLAPTSKIMNFATLAQFWKFCPKEIVAGHTKSQNTIHLKGGAKIIYLTADNERHVDRLRGMEIGSFWADESRLFPSYIWEVLLTRLRSRSGPLRGWATTTPHGYDWLYYYFVKKQHPRTKNPLINAKEYEWFSGTTLDNPHVPEEYKQNLINQLTGKFGRQEIYGDFTGFEGQVYDIFKPQVHILDDVSGLQFKEIIAGLDFGFNNPMACLIIGIDGDGSAYILEEYYRTKQDVENVGDWLLLKKEEYPLLDVIYADPSEPMMINKLNQMGLNIVKANNEVMSGINFVYSLFEVKKNGKPRIFISNKCDCLIEEINSYRYAEPKDNKERKEAPMKVDDHLTDSLRYALFSHLRSRGSYFILKDDEGVFF